MEVPWSEYDATCDERVEHWAPLDEALYDLCRRHPRHDRIGGVNAKCTIIARTYATQIERRIPSTGRQASSISQLGECLWKHGTEVDGFLDALPRVEKPLTVALLETIVTQHGAFVQLLSRKILRGWAAHSFVAKYMHFHRRVVPVYDSNVARALKRLYRWEPHFEVFAKPKNADEEYYWFVMRFWQLYQAAKAQGKDVTVKKLDAFLTRVAERSL